MESIIVWIGDYFCLIYGFVVREVNYLRVEYWWVDSDGLIDWKNGDWVVFLGIYCLFFIVVVY